MSNRVEWSGSTSVGISVIDDEEQRELLTDMPYEDEVTPLAFALDNGGSLYIIEGFEEDLRAFITRCTKTLDDYLTHQMAMEVGIPLGTTVKIGSGRKRWTVGNYRRYQPGGSITAWLDSVDGYSSTSAQVDRLVVLDG